MKLSILSTCFVIATSLLIAACNNDKKQQPAEEYTGEAFGEKPVTATVPEAGSVNGDTVNIQGKFVLFFGPVEVADSMRNTSMEELKTFKAVSTQLMDSLQATGVKAMYSTSGVFRIYTGNSNVMVLSKSAMHAETGILMSDGSQPPTIKKGIHSAAEFSEMIKKYFILQ